MPALEDLAATCDLPWRTREDLNTIPSISNQATLLQRIVDQEPGSAIKIEMFAVHTEGAVPLWREIPRELRLQPKLRASAKETLRKVRKQVFDSIKQTLVSGFGGTK